ncbi:MAG: hypothetical protein HC804_06145 [Anaerolineae bacterium]|nr:hypothetical protein [Anaerolineae bacterium]
MVPSFQSFTPVAASLDSTARITPLTTVDVLLVQAWGGWHGRCPPPNAPNICTDGRVLRWILAGHLLRPCHKESVAASQPEGMLFQTIRMACSLSTSLRIM